MAIPVSDVRTVVRHRVRDLLGTAHDDVILAVLSDCQRVVNACYGAVLSDVVLPLVPGQTLYERASIRSDVVRPLQVTVESRVLHRTSWLEFKHIHPAWFQHQDALPHVWDYVGHNALFIAPSPRTALSATVRYIRETSDLTLTGIFEVPYQYIAAIIDLTCQVLLLRQRLFPSILGEAQSFTRHANPRAVPPS